MTSTAADTLSRIQKDAFVWLTRNYGPAKPLEQLAGLTEEAGEAMEAIGNPDTAEYNDAVGDSAIYLFQFMTLMGWNVADVWDGREAYELPSRPWPILLGRINHAYVKGNIQHYRGTKAEHDARCLQAIGALLKYWDQHLASIGQSFVAVVEATWKKVSARDWTAERPAPGEREEPTLTGVQNMAEEFESMVGDRRMDRGLSLEWAEGACREGTTSVAAAIRRAYAQGIIAERSRTSVVISPGSHDV